METFILCFIGLASLVFLPITLLMIIALYK